MCIFCVTLFVTLSPVGEYKVAKPFDNRDVPQAVIIHCTIHVTAVAVTSAILTPSPPTTRPLPASHGLPIRPTVYQKTFSSKLARRAGEKQVAVSVSIDRCQLGDCWGGPSRAAGRAPRHPLSDKRPVADNLAGGERSLPRRRSIDAEKSARASIPWRTHAVESRRE